MLAASSTLGRNGCLVNFLPSAAAGFCSPRRSAPRRRLAARPGRAARARRGGQGRRAASGVGRAVVLRPAGPDRRATGDRGDQRGRRHQGAGRRQDRGGARRRAIDAGRRQRRGREDERRPASRPMVGGYASGICLAASQTAARYDLPYIVDVGVVDSIVSRGLKNTFRFGPGFGVIAKTAHRQSRAPSTIRPARPPRP